ncbi:MAG: ATP synthase subunit I [Acidimicrobiales bacterium]|nr:ATP synthase subunit I [Acidimicrobiales bacterium]
MSDPVAVEPVAPESDIARHLARRAVLVAPVFLVGGLIGWGPTGLFSAALGLVLVAVNFRLGAAIITRATQISINALYGAVLGGYVARLGLMTAVVLVVKAGGWLATVPFAITLLVTHLGLLVWESRHVALTLAAPGRRPANLNRQEKRST